MAPPINQQWHSMSKGRFVILKHDHPFLHWDLMLERDGTLATWRLLHEPVLQTWLPAERLPDHRIAYLDYEGPVSGDRGVVSRVISGSYTCSTGHGDVEEVSLLDNKFANQGRLRQQPDCAWWFE